MPYVSISDLPAAQKKYLKELAKDARIMAKDVGPLRKFADSLEQESIALSKYVKYMKRYHVAKNILYQVSLKLQQASDESIDMEIKQYRAALDRYNKIVAEGDAKAEKDDAKAEKDDAKAEKDDAKAEVRGVVPSGINISRYNREASNRATGFYDAIMFFMAKEQNSVRDRAKAIYDDWVEKNPERTLGSLSCTETEN